MGAVLEPTRHPRPLMASGLLLSIGSTRRDGRPYIYIYTHCHHVAKRLYSYTHQTLIETLAHSYGSFPGAPDIDPLAGLLF